MARWPGDSCRRIFASRRTYGEVKDSTLDDWPISYDDLEPFYEKAEYEIGVSGDHTPNPFAAPRKKPYPMPAFPYNKEGQVVVQATKRLGLHPFPIPMLRNSVPYNGRPACIHMRSCVGFACPVNAKAGTPQHRHPHRPGDRQLPGENRLRRGRDYRR